MQFLKDFDLNVLLDKISSFLKLARNWRIILGNLSRGRLTFFFFFFFSFYSFFLLTLQARRNIFKSSGDKQNLLGGHNLPPPFPLCVEMGFCVDISLESRRNIEINVWGHFYQISLVFELPYRPESKRCLEKAKTTKTW